MTGKTEFTYTQAYEIRTKVGADVDSKGNVKPSAQVEISRKLENGEYITSLIHADMKHGLEEAMYAIDKVLQRSNK